MSKSVENLKVAFAGESMARNKYTFFAQIARKEGYRYIAKIFEETADDERRHAKDLFKQLNALGDTIANLKEAIEGEDHEVNKMYADFAREAKEEGNKEATILFNTMLKLKHITAIGIREFLT